MTCTATHLCRRREGGTRRSDQGILERDRDEKHQAIPGQEGGITRKSRLYPNDRQERLQGNIQGEKEE